MSRKFAAALALLIAVALLPIPALAAPAQTLDFTTMDTVDNTAERWTWDKDSLTLTLNGATLAVPLRLPGGAKIVVNGNNSISVSHQNDLSQDPQNFVVSCSQGTVTITGPGTLNITYGTGQDLNVDNGPLKDLWIGNLVLGMEGKPGPTVNLTQNMVKGVAITGDVIVHSGKLNIKALSRAGDGIEGDVTVTGGSLNIEAMNGGIVGSLYITGGSVRAMAKNDATSGVLDEYDGIAFGGLLKVKGGEVWLTSYTPGGHHADRFAPAILEEPLLEEGLTIKGSTIYNDPSPTQTVTWKPYGTAVIIPPDIPINPNPNPGGRSNRAPARSPGELLYPFIGDTPAKTVRISAGDDSGSQSGIIIYVPTDDTPNTTTSNPTTGANDFVSTATAAALMALLGAAALLRK